MNPLGLYLISVFTLLVMLTFVGICIWAWNARHAAAFERLARLPLADQSVDINQAQDRQP